MDGTIKRRQLVMVKIVTALLDCGSKLFDGRKRAAGRGQVEDIYLNFKSPVGPVICAIWGE